MSQKFRQDLLRLFNRKVKSASPTLATTAVWRDTSVHSNAKQTKLREIWLKQLCPLNNITLLDFVQEDD